MDGWQDDPGRPPQKRRRRTEEILDSLLADPQSSTWSDDEIRARLEGIRDAERGLPRDTLPVLPPIEAAPPPEPPRPQLGWRDLPLPSALGRLARSAWGDVSDLPSMQLRPPADPNAAPAPPPVYTGGKGGAYRMPELGVSAGSDRVTVGKPMNPIEENLRRQSLERSRPPNLSVNRPRVDAALAKLTERIADPSLTPEQRLPLVATKHNLEQQLELGRRAGLDVGQGEALEQYGKQAASAVTFGAVGGAYTREMDRRMKAGEWVTPEDVEALLGEPLGSATTPTVGKAGLAGQLTGGIAQFMAGEGLLRAGTSALAATRFAPLARPAEAYFKAAYTPVRPGTSALGYALRTGAQGALQGAPVGVAIDAGRALVEGRPVGESIAYGGLYGAGIGALMEVGLPLPGGAPWRFAGAAKLPFSRGFAATPRPIHDVYAPGRDPQYANRLQPEGYAPTRDPAHAGDNLQPETVAHLRPYPERVDATDRPVEQEMPGVVEPELAAAPGHTGPRIMAGMTAGGLLGATAGGLLADEDNRGAGLALGAALGLTLGAGFGAATARRMAFPRLPERPSFWRDESGVLGEQYQPGEVIAEQLSKEEMIEASRQLKEKGVRFRPRPNGDGTFALVARGEAQAQAAAAPKEFGEPIPYDPSAPPEANRPLLGSDRNPLPYDPTGRFVSRLGRAITAFADSDRMTPAEWAARLEKGGDWAKDEYDTVLAPILKALQEGDQVKAQTLFPQVFGRPAGYASQNANAGFGQDVVSPLLGSDPSRWATARLSKDDLLKLAYHHRITGNTLYNSADYRAKETPDDRRNRAMVSWRDDPRRFGSDRHEWENPFMSEAWRSAEADEDIANRMRVQPAHEAMRAGTRHYYYGLADEFAEAIRRVTEDGVTPDEAYADWRKVAEERVLADVDAYSVGALAAQRMGDDYVRIMQVARPDLDDVASVSIEELGGNPSIPPGSYSYRDDVQGQWVVRTPEGTTLGSGWTHYQAWRDAAGRVRYPENPRHAQEMELARQQAYEQAFGEGGQYVGARELMDKVLQLKAAEPPPIRTMEDIRLQGPDAARAWLLAHHSDWADRQPPTPEAYGLVADENGALRMGPENAQSGPGVYDRPEGHLVYDQYGHYVKKDEAAAMAREEASANRTPRPGEPERDTGPTSYLRHASHMTHPRTPGHNPMPGSVRELLVQTEPRGLNPYETAWSQQRGERDWNSQYGNFHYDPPLIVHDQFTGRWTHPVTGEAFFMGLEGQSDLFNYGHKSGSLRSDSEYQRGNPSETIAPWYGQRTRIYETRRFTSLTEAGEASRKAGDAVRTLHDRYKNTAGTMDQSFMDYRSQHEMKEHTETFNTPEEAEAFALEQHAAGNMPYVSGSTVTVYPGPDHVANLFRDWARTPDGAKIFAEVEAAFRDWQAALGDLRAADQAYYRMATDGEPGPVDVEVMGGMPTGLPDGFLRSQEGVVRVGVGRLLTDWAERGGDDHIGWMDGRTLELRWNPTYRRMYRLSYDELWPAEWRWMMQWLGRQTGDPETFAAMVPVHDGGEQLRYGRGGTMAGETQEFRRVGWREKPGAWLVRLSPEQRAKLRAAVLQHGLPFMSLAPLPVALAYSKANENADPDERAALSKLEQLAGLAFMLGAMRYGNKVIREGFASGREAAAFRATVEGEAHVRPNPDGTFDVVEGPRPAREDAAPAAPEVPYTKGAPAEYNRPERGSPGRELDVDPQGRTYDRLGATLAKLPEDKALTAKEWHGKLAKSRAYTARQFNAVLGKPLEHIIAGRADTFPWLPDVLGADPADWGDVRLTPSELLQIADRNGFKFETARLSHARPEPVDAAALAEAQLARQGANLYAPSEGPLTGPKYADHLIPGGESYRELLTVVRQGNPLADEYGRTHPSKTGHYPEIPGVHHLTRIADYIINGEYMTWLDEGQSDPANKAGETWQNDDPGRSNYTPDADKAGTPVRGWQERTYEREVVDAGTADVEHRQAHAEQTAAVADFQRKYDHAVQTATQLAARHGIASQEEAIRLLLTDPATRPIIMAAREAELAMYAAQEYVAYTRQAFDWYQQGNTEPFTRERMNNPRGVPPSFFVDNTVVAQFNILRLLTEWAENGRGPWLGWSNADQLASRWDQSWRPLYEHIYDKGHLAYWKAALKELGFTSSEIAQMMPSNGGTATKDVRAGWTVRIPDQFVDRLRQAVLGKGLKFLTLSPLGLVGLYAELSQQAGDNPEAAELQSHLKTIAKYAAGAAAGGVALYAAMKGVHALRRGAHGQLEGRTPKPTGELPRYDTHVKGRPGPGGTPPVAGRGPLPRLTENAVKRLDLPPELSGQVVQMIEYERGLTGDTPRVETWDELRAIAAERMGLGEDALMDVDPERADRHTLLAIASLAVQKKNTAELFWQRSMDPSLSVSEQRANLAHASKMDEDFLHLMSGAMRGGSEAGRNLNALKVLANLKDDPAYWWTRTMKLLDRPLTGEERSKIEGFLKDKDRAGLVQYLARLRKTSIPAQIVTLLNAGLFTRPAARGIDLLSSGGNLLLEHGVNAPMRVLLDRAVALATGTRTATMPDALQVEGIGRGAWHGLQQAARSMGFHAAMEAPAGQRWAAWREYIRNAEISPDMLARYDLPHLTNIDMFSLARDPETPVNVAMDLAQKLIYRSLGVTDRILVNAAYEGAIADLAMARALGEGAANPKQRAQELIAAPPDDMRFEANLMATRITFNNDEAAALMGKKLMRAPGDALRSIEGPTATAAAEVTDAAMRFQFPVVRTAANITARAMDYLPGVGTTRGLYNLWSAFRPELERSLRNRKQRVAVEVLSRNLTGTGMVALGAYLYEQGIMTGAASTEPGERAVEVAEGQSPNSMLIDGEWRPIGRLAPFGTSMAIGATMAQIAKHRSKEGGPLGFGVGAASALGRTILDQPFLTGSQSALDALQDPVRASERYLESQAGRIVPSIVNEVANASGFSRDVNGPLEAIQGRLPGLAEQLPIRHTGWGDPIRGRTGLMNRLFNPVAGSPDNRIDNPVVAQAGELGYAPSRIARDKATPTTPRETPEAYSERAAFIGALRKDVAGELFQTSPLFTDPAYLDRVAREWMMGNPDMAGKSLEEVKREVQRSALVDVVRGVSPHTPPDYIRRMRAQP